MICLSKRQILFLHEELIWETGGSPGLQDEALLDSALAAPFQTFDGQPLYPSLQQKAACLCYGLVMDHLFWTETSESELMPCWYSWLSMGSNLTIHRKNSPPHPADLRGGGQLRGAAGLAVESRAKLNHTE